MYRCLALATLLVAAPALAQHRPLPTRMPRPDLADAVAGTYEGTITADTHNASGGPLTVTVTKVGPNTVSVTADHRLPSRQFKLAKYMAAIENNGGAPGEVFLVETNKDPNALGLTIDQAAASVHRAP